MSLFHSYNIALLQPGPQLTLNWVVDFFPPFRRCLRPSPRFPNHLRGHCVLIPRGTIIPDSGALSLGHRRRGNSNCTESSQLSALNKSMSTVDSGDTTDPQSKQNIYPLKPSVSTPESGSAVSKTLMSLQQGHPCATLTKNQVGYRGNQLPHLDPDRFCTHRRSGLLVTVLHRQTRKWKSIVDWKRKFFWPT